MDARKNMPGSRTISILIAEDHEITRVGLKLTLEQLPGLKVIDEAEDGSTAVQKAIELKPEVVLMDIGLPLLDGIEATQKIKERCPGTRVIMLTSHDNDQDIFASLAAGADGYCLKEITSSQLSMAIHTVAEGAAWLDPGVASRVLRSCAGVMPQGVAEGIRPAPDYLLSEREAEVLKLLVEGLTNAQIAASLELSVETIKTHVRHIMEKLAVSDRTQAAVKAMREGLV